MDSEAATKEAHRFLLSFRSDPSARRKSILIECNAKCRYSKKIDL
jgi:hypothetical protein